MDDITLDRWAEIFRANHLRQRYPGLTFIRFLQSPEKYLWAVCFGKSSITPGQIQGQ